MLTRFYIREKERLNNLGSNLSTFDNDFFTHSDQASARITWWEDTNGDDFGRSQPHHTATETRQRWTASARRYTAQLGSNQEKQQV